MIFINHLGEGRQYMCALPATSFLHASTHMAPVRHLSTVELGVWAITSNLKTLPSRRLHGWSGLISTMYGFPFVFLLGAGSWARVKYRGG